MSLMLAPSSFFRETARVLWPLLAPQAARLSKGEGLLPMAGSLLLPDTLCRSRVDSSAPC